MYIMKMKTQKVASPYITGMLYLNYLHINSIDEARFMTASQNIVCVCVYVNSQGDPSLHCVCALKNIYS